MIEEQGAVAGAVALGADVVQTFEQGHQPVEVLQTDDVAIANLARLRMRHAVI